MSKNSKPLINSKHFLNIPISSLQKSLSNFKITKRKQPPPTLKQQHQHNIILLQQLIRSIDMQIMKKTILTNEQLNHIVCFLMKYCSMINIHYMRASETGDAGRDGNGISQEKYSTRTSDKENGLRKDGEKYQIKNIDNKQGATVIIKKQKEKRQRYNRSELINNLQQRINELEGVVTGQKRQIDEMKNGQGQQQVEIIDNNDKLNIELTNIKIQYSSLQKQLQTQKSQSQTLRNKLISLQNTHNQHTINIHTPILTTSSQILKQRLSSRQQQLTAVWSLLATHSVYDY